MRNREKIGSSYVKKGQPDIWVLLIVSLLAFLGVILVYDASVVRASSVFGGKYYFLIFQLIWVILGLIVLFVVSNIEYERFVNLSGKLLVLSLVLLSLTVVTRFLPVSVRGLAEVFIPNINASHRWIYLNYKPLPPIPVVGRLGFQPSELAKISLVLYLVSVLASKKRDLVSLHCVFIIGIVGFLILLQPDFGTASILVLTGLAVYLASGSPIKNVLALLVLALLLGIFFVMTSPYRRERLASYLNLSPTREESLSSKYQINQVLIALGSGGLWGLGLGQSRQKYDYIPEVNTDSIFSVWGEETGFVGAVFLVLVYAALVYKGLRIAATASSLRGSLLATGVTSFIGLQTIINLAGMTHLLPLTGVPLPMISYGGSSLLAGMFSLGILLNVSKYRKGSK
jgi:cell division protein FtsW